MAGKTTLKVDCGWPECGLYWPEFQLYRPEFQLYRHECWLNWPEFRLYLPLFRLYLPEYLAWPGLIVSQRRRRAGFFGTSTT